MRPEEVREIVRACIAEMPVMCEDEVRAVVRETVNQTLTSLGVDGSSPLEVQQDLAWLRRTRRATGSVAGKVGAALVTLVVGAVVAAAWAGFRLLVHRGP